MKLARMDAGLTKTELARRAGVARDTITNAEEDNHLPNAGTLYKIAAVLGKQPSELLAEEERLAPKGRSRSELEPSLFNAVERHEPSEADFRAINAIQDRCNRLEAYLAHTAGKDAPDDYNRLVLRVMLGMVGIVGELAPAVMEKESARDLIRPVGARFLQLAKALVARAEQWELAASETVEAHATVVSMEEWANRAS